MELTQVSLDELVALSLRSLRRAPAGLATLLSAAAESLDADLVAAYLAPAAGGPEILSTGGKDGPSLSQRADEDHQMLRALAREMKPTDVAPDLRAGKWRDYQFVAAISSYIDEHTTCILVAAGTRPVDEGLLRRMSAPVTILAYVIAQDRRSRGLRRQAVEADQELSLLLAGLHHDLRTPLTTILGSAQTIISRANRLSDEIRAELLESIVRQAERMTRMVSDTLSRARDRDGPVRPATVNVKHLAERAAGAAMMSRRGHVTAEAPDVDACIDGDRLERALLNLLDNALKYSPEGAPVYLIAEVQDGWARFTIADNGPGVAHDVLPRLFTPYVSDPARSDGTGLGLNSAKHLIERDLDGRLSYSRRDGWTRFVAAVPVNGEGCP